MWGIGFYGGGSYIVHAGEHIGGWRPTLPQTWGADRLVQGSAAKVMAARFHTAEWLIENWDAKGDRTARSVPVSKARAATGVTPNQMLMMLVVLKGSGGDRPGTPRNVAQYLVRNGASQGVAWDGGSTTQLAIWPDRIDQHAYATARQPPCFVVLFECCPFRGDKG